MSERITVSDEFAKFSEFWVARVVATLNGQDVKLVKLSGEFVWHHHEAEDELFLVHRGRLRMEFRDRVVDLNAGDMIVVERGVEHRPVAVPEAEVILFEPAGTVNTGNVTNERTVAPKRTA